VTQLRIKIRLSALQSNVLTILDHKTEKKNIITQEDIILDISGVQAGDAEDAAASPAYFG